MAAWFVQVGSWLGARAWPWQGAYVGCMVIFGRRWHVGQQVQARAAGKGVLGVYCAWREAGELMSIRKVLMLISWGIGLSDVGVDLVKRCS